DTLVPQVASPRAVLTGTAPDHSEGMSYLERLPKRLVTLYLPLGIIMLVLMFPFYWMALTAIKPDEQLLDLERFNPFWTWTPTLKHIHKLLFETNYPLWLWNTMLVAVAATILSIIASVLAAYAIVRLRYRGAQWAGGAIFLAYLVPPSILLIPLSTVSRTFAIEFVDCSSYRVSSLRAADPVASMPAVVLYALLGAHYVSAMTGAVRE